VAIAAALPTATQSLGSPRSCDAAGSKTIVANSAVRIYRARHYPDLIACLFATGNTQVLDAPNAAIYGFPPPAIALAGTVVGHAEDSCSANSCRTWVAAEDLAAQPPAYQELQAANANARGQHRLVKVGSLAVHADGGLAWISCREPRHSDTIQQESVVATPAPNCVRPGDLDYVLARDAKARENRLLDSGHAIAPASLRRKGALVCWRRAGKQRCARLH
jgi:hypothetical protein